MCGRTFKKFVLTEDKKKIAEESLPFAYFMMSQIMSMRDEHLDDNEMDDIKSEMLISYLQSVERHDASRGALTTIAAISMKGAYMRRFANKDSSFTKRLSTVDLSSSEAMAHVSKVFTKAAFYQTAFFPKESCMEDVKSLIGKSDLSELEKEIVNRYFMEKQTLKDIAKDKKVSKQYISVVLHTGIQKIKDYTKSHGISMSDFV